MNTQSSSSNLNTKNNISHSTAYKTSTPRNVPSMRLSALKLSIPVYKYCFIELQGYNCCLFSYGQTGAGKTYSIIGEDPDDQSS